jgi:hypothetical protein
MYIDINTLFTFEVSKSDDQSILAAIVNSIHFQYTLLLGNFLFLYCNESVLFFLILNIQIGRFEFVKKFDTVRL